MKNNNLIKKVLRCPECGSDMKKGVLEIAEAGNITQSFVTATWYSDEEKDKLLRKNAVNLDLKAEAYYCEECMKVFAVFEERW